jgi:Methyltransferase domain
MNQTLKDLLTDAPRWATVRPDDREIRGLKSLCEAYLTKASVVAEIGSYGGESTIIFAEACKTIHAIDPWSFSSTADMFIGCGDAAIPASFAPRDYPSMAQVEAIFDARVSPYPNVRKIKADSDEAVGLFADASLDMVYIDALHTYDVVRRSIDLWQPRLKADGVMAGHDYSVYWPGVMQAVNEAYGAPDRTFEDSSWAVRLATGRRSKKDR